MEIDSTDDLLRVSTPCITLYKVIAQESFFIFKAQIHGEDIPNERNHLEPHCVENSCINEVNNTFPAMDPNHTFHLHFDKCMRTHHSF